MSESREVRVREQLKNLEGIDAKPHLEGMRQELRKIIHEGRRRAEVDGVDTSEERLKVSAMAFQNASGSWRIESMGEVFPGQNGTITATDQHERTALVEFRFALMQELVSCRYCREDKARSLATKAIIDVHGRVPYVRISSTVV